MKKKHVFENTGEGNEILRAQGFEVTMTLF